MTRILLAAALTLLVTYVSQAQYTTIPDSNFELALAAYDDIPGDNQVPTANISVLTNLNVSGQNIADVTGIEDFIAITNLSATNNQLASIDLTQNTALQTVSLLNNLISTIDLSQNTALKNLYLQNNQLTSLDISQNTDLLNLFIENNQLTSLDVSLNVALTHLYCNTNQLSIIDVSQNTVLDVLDIGNNQIATLDLSQNSVLRGVACNNNQLTSLNLSAHSALIVLDCSNNSALHYLNVKNGNNANVIDFIANNNSSLSCIDVDNALYSTTNWTNIDAGTSFSEDCHPNETFIPDANFEAYLETHDANGNLVTLGDPVAMGNGIANDNLVTTLKISAVTSLNVSNLNIADLTGIEDFVGLISLSVTNNQLTSIDLSQNTALQYLYLSNNLLTTIDLSQNTALLYLYISGNQLSDIDLALNSDLVLLRASFNQLTSMDINQNVNLRYLYADNNLLSGINTTLNINLEYFYAGYNAITFLDLSKNTSLSLLSCGNNPGLSYLNMKNGNNLNVIQFSAQNIPNLTCIEVDDAVYSSGNWTGIDPASSFSTDCYPTETFIPDPNFELYLETHDANGNIVVIGDASSLGNGIDNDHFVTTFKINNVTVLNASSNGIADLTGIQEFVALTDLNVGNNALTLIDLSQNSNLSILAIDNNQLTNISLSQNTALTQLICNNNALTQVNLKMNSLLTDLQCQNNQLGLLDLSSHSGLTALDCSNNPALNYLNVRNGNNANITQFIANNNASLSCIDVDNAVYSTSNWTTIDVGASFSENCHPNETYIPDSNFEAYLETHDTNGNVVNLGDPSSLGNGIANDHFVTTANISSVQYLSLYNQNISDLTGIEDFLALINFYVDNNQLSAIDVTQNLNLTSLSVRNNDLMTLDVSANTALTYLDCDNNQLSSIDISLNINLDTFYSSNNQIASLDVSQNTNLTILACGNNQLTTLNTSQNTSLSQLTCYGNQLTALNLTQNTGLIGLSCDSNQITALDLSQNPALLYLYCGDNLLTSIDTTPHASLSWLTCNNNMISSLDLSQNTLLVSLSADNNQLTSLDLGTNTELEYLYVYDNQLTQLELGSNNKLETLSCENNQITNLHLSVNPALTTVICYNNALTRLDIKNNSNSNITSFSAGQNPSLTCIEVDDVGYSTSTWTNIDPASSFSTSCPGGLTYVPDDSFEQALINLGYDTGALDDYVPTSNIEVLTSLNISNFNIADVTGIEDFRDLLILDCSSNQIDQLDVSNNLVLQALDCSSNALERLNVKNGNNTNFILFDASTNPNLLCIEVDDVSYSTTNWTLIDPVSTFNLDCHYGETYVPDDNFEQYLISYGYDSGVLDDYVPTNNINTIQNLSIANLNISDLTGIEDFVSLTTLYCPNNQLTSLDLSQNTALTTLYCFTNQLTTLNLTSNTNLTMLDCSTNQIASLDLSANTALTQLFCNSNQLTSLDVSMNTALIYLYVNSNQLSSIDVTQNLALEVLDIGANQFTTLDISQNPVLYGLGCNDNQFTSLDLSQITTLTALFAGNNPLTSLNIKNGNNANVFFFDALNSADLTCIEVDDPVAFTTSWSAGIDAHAAFSSNCGEVTLEAKAYLQGAFLNPNTGEETLMRDDLRVAGLIPTTSPYDITTCNATVFNVTGADAIVDWIWVELRDDTVNTTVIEAQSALLQRDGDIVGVDGVSPLTFIQNAKHYNVVVKHRNHLGVMSGTRVPFPKDQIVDYASGAMSTYGVNGNTILNTVNVLWAGNAGSDTTLKYQGAANDANTIKDNVIADAGTPNNLHSYTAYDNADVNLDGTIRYQGADNDTNTIKDIILSHPDNNPSGSNLFSILEQLPEN